MVDVRVYLSVCVSICTQRHTRYEAETICSFMKGVCVYLSISVSICTHTHAHTHTHTHMYALTYVRAYAHTHTHTHTHTQDDIIIEGMS